VKSRTIEKFFDWLYSESEEPPQSDQIWGDPSQLAIEKTHSTWIACVVPYIDGETVSHKQPSMVGLISTYPPQISSEH